MHKKTTLFSWARGRREKLDTQWSRFQVFLQEKHGAPHQDVGSVHAPDSEMALFNARDVFVRRPDCTSLWVAPADAIYSKTAEELKTWHPDLAESLDPGGSEQRYLVFCKAKTAGTQTYIGSVQASSPGQAMIRALEELPQQPEPFVWWVLPASAVVESDPQEVASLFAPAREKTFRLSTDFHTHSTMRKLRKGSGKA